MWDFVNLKWDVAGKENVHSVGFLWISKGYKRHRPMEAVARKVGLCQVSTRRLRNRGLLDQLLERLVPTNEQIGLLYVNLSLTSITVLEKLSKCQSQATLREIQSPSQNIPFTIISLPNSPAPEHIRHT